MVVLTILFYNTTLYGNTINLIVENDPEPGGVITGKILDQKTKVPLEYSSIAIYSLSDSSLITGTVTDESGKFVLSNIPYGSYYLEARFVGYDNSTSQPVYIEAGARKVDLGSIYLALNTNELAEVEVVADQRRVEYKIDKKVVNVSEDLNAAGGTAVDVLENTPSVSVDIEGNVSLRGSGSFTVLINGKPTVLDASDALRQIPASSIQNIEIITNPSVKYDPDGNGGIINVVLKKQAESGTTGIVNASIGLNHKYRLDALVNERTGKLNYFVGGNYSDNLYQGNLHREHASYTTDGEEWLIADGNFDFIHGGYQLKGGMDYDITPKSNIAFELNGGGYSFGMNRSNTTYQYTIPESTNTYYNNIDVTDRTGMYYSGNLNFTQSFDTTAHKLVGMAFLSYRNGESIEDIEYIQTDADYIQLPGTIASQNRNIENGNSYDVRLKLDYTKPLNNGTLEAGYEGRIDDNYDDYIYQEYDPDTETWNNVGDMSSGISFYRNIQGAYVQYGGQFNKLQVQAGLRGEYTYRLAEYENFNTSYEINRFDIYPTLHLSRQFEKDNQLMLSYSKRVNRPRGHNLDSIPNYIDAHTIRIGNPGLEPEFVHSYELGYQKGWGKNFLAFETFYRNTVNLITRTTQYDGSTGIYYQRYENINEDHAIGSELMLNYQVAKWFNLNASTDGYYYLLKGELYGNVVDTSSFVWNANANATFNLGKLTRLQTNIGYRGPSVTAQGSAAGMYFMNLALRRDFFNRKLSATLQVRDLFGTMKREFTISGTDINTGTAYSQYVFMQREPRVVMLSLSYKINNYKEPRNNNGQESGMDMDSGF